MSNSERKNYLNQIFVTLYKIPWIKNRWAKKFDAQLFDDIPWTKVTKPLKDCRLALVTTSGVHLKNDRPFNMADKEGDPSLRVIPWPPSRNDLIITHDYYDHSDAEKDINVVLPIDPMKKCLSDGIIGSVSSQIYSFMGHIIGQHIPTLVEKSAKNLVHQLHRERIDLVLLSPA